MDVNIETLFQSRLMKPIFIPIFPEIYSTCSINFKYLSIMKPRYLILLTFSTTTLFIPNELLDCILISINFVLLYFICVIHILSNPTITFLTRFTLSKYESIIRNKLIITIMLLISNPAGHLILLPSY